MSDGAVSDGADTGGAGAVAGMAVRADGRGGTVDGIRDERSAEVARDRRGDGRREDVPDEDVGRGCESALVSDMADMKWTNRDARR